MSATQRENAHPDYQKIKTDHGYVIVTARNGLTAKIPEVVFGTLSVKYGPNIREAVLNNAGRVLKHRRILDAAYAQKITDEQRKQIDALARAYAVQSAINHEIVKMGYGNYLTRSERGGPMPKSWGRICDLASERINVDAVNPNESDRDAAMNDLRLFTDDDISYSKNLIQSTEKWEINAPEGWGE